MSAEAMTYDSLVNDVIAYAERSDNPFAEQIPRLIMMAENRIASSPEVRGLGFQQYVTGTMSSNTFSKPVRWRETLSLNITVGGKRVFLRQRSYDYCRLYANDPSVTGQPRFYANYDFEHFFIAPTPNISYPFELGYYERPEPLSAQNQTNWTTQYAPQLILFATLLEAQPFLKRTERLQEFKMLYDEAVAALAGESVRRAMARSEMRGTE